MKKHSLGDLLPDVFAKRKYANISIEVPEDKIDEVLAKLRALDPTLDIWVLPSGNGKVARRSANAKRG